MKSLVIGNQFHGETADRNTFGETFGYVSPTHVLYAIFLNEGDSSKEFILLEYGEKAKSALENFTHVNFKGIDFPLNKKGIEKMRDFDLGLPESKMIEIVPEKVQASFVRLSGEYGKSRTTLRPIIKNDGKWWAMPELGEISRIVGDNVCLTGGGRQSQTGFTSGASVPYSYETFNAGGGRVTASKVGDIFIPTGVVECQLVANFN